MHAFSTGVRPELIRTSLPFAATRLLNNQVFDYDYTKVENPTGRMDHFDSCRERFGGLCPNKDDDYCDPATFLTYNMFLSCKGLKKELPMMLAFSARDCGFHCFLGRLHGNCESAHIAQLVSIPRTDEQPFDRCDLLREAELNDDDRLVHYPLASHKYFQRLFRTVAGQELVCDVGIIETVSQQRWAYDRDDSVAHFRIEPIVEMINLSCMCKAKPMKDAAKVAEEDDLPFGLGKKPRKDPKPK